MSMTGYSTRRRTNAYTFDHELFRKWMAGGAVWLDDEPGPDQDDPVESRQSDSRTTEDSVRRETADIGDEFGCTCKNTFLTVQNGKSDGNVRSHQG